MFMQHFYINFVIYLYTLFEKDEGDFFPLEETAAQTIILGGFIRRKAILAPRDMLAVLLRIGDGPP